MIELIATARTRLLAVTALFLFPFCLHSSPAPDPVLDESIRGRIVNVRMLDGRKVRGRYEGRTQSGLLLSDLSRTTEPAEGSRPVREIPIAEVEYVEDDGSGAAKWSGAALGGLYGLISGAALAGAADESGALAFITGVGAGATGGGLFGYYSGRSFTRHRYYFATTVDGRIVAVRPPESARGSPAVTVRGNAGVVLKRYVDEAGYTRPSGGLGVGFYFPIRPGLKLGAEINYNLMATWTETSQGLYPLNEDGASIIGTTRSEYRDGRLYDATLLLRGELTKSPRGTTYLEAGYGMAYLTGTKHSETSIGSFRQSSVTRDTEFYPGCLVAGGGWQFPIGHSMGIDLRGQLAVRFPDLISDPRFSVGLAYNLGR
ncbi:MAG: hypothetical protein AB1714_21410 [Acidobacteriota bacterium]